MCAWHLLPRKRLHHSLYILCCRHLLDWHWLKQCGLLSCLPGWNLLQWHWCQHLCCLSSLSGRHLLQRL